MGHWSLRKAREVRVRLFGLGLEGLDDPGVAVALVDGRIGAQEIEVLLALDVPHPDPLGLADDDVQGVVVVGPVEVFDEDEVLAVHCYCSYDDDSVLSSAVYLAERAGFEPAVHLAAHTRFPSVLLKPLGHLSGHVRSGRKPRGNPNLSKIRGPVNFAGTDGRRLIYVDDVLQQSGAGPAGVRPAPDDRHRAHGVRVERDSLGRPVGRRRADGRRRAGRARPRVSRGAPGPPSRPSP